MSQCVKCATPVNAQDSISCVECKAVFHTSCVQLRSAKLPTVRNIWKCEGCVSELSSNSSRISDKDKEPGSEASAMSAILKGIEGMRRDMGHQFSEVKTQLSTVNETITGMKAQLDNLAKENETRRNEYLELKQENAGLKSEVEALRSQIQENEQYSRRDNVEIVGVPFSPREDVYAILNGIAGIIGLPFSKADVSIAHRMPDTKKTGKPIIIVKFVNRHFKQDWINGGRGCKQLTAAGLCSSWQPTRIFINDHLTPNNKKLLGHMRGLVKEKKIVGAWTTDCKLKMRVSENGRVHHIKTMEDIEKAVSSTNQP